MARRRSRPAHRASPHRTFLLLAGLWVALLTAAAHWAARWPWPWAYLASVNVVTVGLYGLDKHRSTAGGTRVPEKVLHLIAFVGATPAAFASQRLFRHKTIKARFQIWFWIIFAAQVGLLAGWWWGRP